MRNLLLLSACCSLTLTLSPATAVAQYDGAASVPDQFATGFGSIAAEDTKAWLSVLAGPEFQGRGTGQEGFLKAADWFAKELAALGFQPASADGSWFQNVPFYRVAVDTDKSSLKAGDAILSTPASFGISQFVGEYSQELPVTFAAVTNTRPEIADDAFSGQLLIVRSANSFRPDDPLVLKGRPACLLIVQEETDIRTESVSRLEESHIDLPTAQISRTAAAALAEKSGVAASLLALPETSLIVTSSAKATISFTVERESIDVPNVVAWYPGSDDTVNHEYVAIGAHLDHLGTQREDVFPGADDNASGSTAILQIAKALHHSETKPRRSVLLMAFCAEERGLLGSKYYCENPLRPLKDMVCMLNIDMIGRNEETADEPASQNDNTIHLVGSKKISEQLHELVMDANRYVNFVFEYDEERVNSRSDHASFAAKGVPVTFLFGGFNPHYHKTTDTLDGINFEKIANAARLNFLTLMMAAEHGHFSRNP